MLSQQSDPCVLRGLGLRRKDAGHGSTGRLVPGAPSLVGSCIARHPPPFSSLLLPRPGSLSSASPRRAPAQGVGPANTRPGQRRRRRALWVKGGLADDWPPVKERRARAAGSRWHQRGTGAGLANSAPAGLCTLAAWTQSGRTASGTRADRVGPGRGTLWVPCRCADFQQPRRARRRG